MDTITKRIDHIANISRDYLTEIPPPPKSVKIELSPRCNYRCSYCALSTRLEQPKQDMDWTLFKKISDELKEIEVEEVGVFYIGESFMNPDLLVSAIRYLKSNLEIPYVFLTSNASLATPFYVEKCMIAGLDSLKWSCNVSDKNQFRSIIRVSEKVFEKAIDNIKDAFQIRNMGRFNTKLYASSIYYDDRQPDLMRPFLEKNVLPYVDEHYWLPLLNHGFIFSNSKSGLSYKPGPGNTGRFNAPVDPLPCWSLHTAGHVLADGRLSACCFDGTGEWTMGDLKAQPFMEAWHSDEFKKLRSASLNRDMKGTKCENCIAYQKEG